jgi:hypothetical protein
LPPAGFARSAAGEAPAFRAATLAAGISELAGTPLAKVLSFAAARTAPSICAWAPALVSSARW